MRLPFEPRGELREYRDALRAALRTLAPAPGQVLVATYLSPNREFVDAENVLLYNVGAGSYAHLAASGLSVSRVRSPDELHHLRYRVAAMAALPPGDLLATVESAMPPDPHSPGAWWSALRPAVTLALPDTVPVAAVTLEVTLHRSGPNPRLAGIVKPLLDGLVSALHAHDGTDHDVLAPRLASFGHPEQVWSLLCSTDAAALGTRRLIRPHGAGLAWNPADELCRALTLRVLDRADNRIAAIVRTAEPD